MELSSNWFGVIICTVKSVEQVHHEKIVSGEDQEVVAVVAGELKR